MRLRQAWPRGTEVQELHERSYLRGRRSTQSERLLLSPPLSRFLSTLSLLPTPQGSQVLLI